MNFGQISIFSNFVVRSQIVSPSSATVLPVHGPPRLFHETLHHACYPSRHLRYLATAEDPVRLCNLVVAALSSYSLSPTMAVDTLETVCSASQRAWEVIHQLESPERLDSWTSATPSDSTRRFMISLWGVSAFVALVFDSGSLIRKIPGLSAPLQAPLHALFTKMQLDHEFAVRFLQFLFAHSGKQTADN